MTTTRQPRPFLDHIDYLTATCDTPVGFGERFAASMRRQGDTVTRYTPEPDGRATPLLRQVRALRESQGCHPPRLGRAS